MPVLKDFRETKTIQLKTVEDGEATIVREFLAADLEKMAQGEGGNKKICMPFTLIIKAWNLTDENGVVLPINEENVGKLCYADVKAIQAELDLKDFLGNPAADMNSTKQ
jgi:hypothetical protein